MKRTTNYISLYVKVDQDTYIKVAVVLKEMFDGKNIHVLRPISKLPKIKKPVKNIKTKKPVRTKKPITSQWKQLIRDWNVYRKIKLKLPSFTKTGRTMHLNKLKKFSNDNVETAKLIQHQSEEYNWRGIFPLIEYKQNAVKKPANKIQTPEQIIQEYHNKPFTNISVKLDVRKFQELNMVFKIQDAQELETLCHKMLDFLEWIESKQSKKVRLLIDEGSNILIAASNILLEYTKWLAKQTWINSYNPNMLNPEHKIFTNFRNHYKKQIGMDFITGN